MQGASSQNRSSQATSTGGGSLSAPVLTVSLPVYTLAYTPTTIGTDADKQAAAAAMASAQWQQHTGFSGSGAIFSSPISNPYRTVNGVSSFLSADEYLANSNGNSASSRYRAPSIGGGTTAAWLNWLSQQWKDGKTDITLAELRALYDLMRAQDGDFANTYTWEDFYNWFLSQQGSEGFKWALPVGDGTWVMLILITLYLLYKTLISTLTN